MHGGYGSLQVVIFEADPGNAHGDTHATLTSSQTRYFDSPPTNWTKAMPCSNLKMNEQWGKKGMQKIDYYLVFFPHIGFFVVVSNLALAQLVAGPIILIIEIG